MAIVYLLSASRMKVKGFAQGSIRTRRNDGFTLIEILLLLAVIGIVGGFATFTISREFMPGLRANQAMYQTMASLREARMLAMNHNTMVSIQFASGGTQVTAQILDGPVAGANWMSIPDYATAKSIKMHSNPSTDLGTKLRFNRNDNEAPPNGSALGDVVFGVDAVTGRAVFNEDGFMTNGIDLDSPINGTIYIGAPDNANADLGRAITIRGATGVFTAWQWRLGRWERVR